MWTEGLEYTQCMWMEELEYPDYFVLLVKRQCGWKRLNTHCLHKSVNSMKLSQLLHENSKGGQRQRGNVYLSSSAHMHHVYSSPCVHIVYVQTSTSFKVFFLFLFKHLKGHLGNVRIKNVTHAGLQMTFQMLRLTKMQHIYILLTNPIDFR